MDNIPTDSRLLTSMIPLAIMLIIIAVGTYLVAFVGLRWYRSHKRGGSKIDHFYLTTKLACQRCLARIIQRQDQSTITQ